MEPIAQLPMVGGHPALDLVNTAQREAPVPGPDNGDYLRTAADLLVWCERAGVVTDAEQHQIQRQWSREPGGADVALRTVREIRECAYRVLAVVGDAQTPPDPAVREATGTLHRLWVGALGEAELDPSQPEHDQRLRVGTKVATMITDRLVHATVELIRTVDRERLRQCPIDAGGCGWMFLDRSRNGSRRWCRMADCGTQVKSRRLTQRRRDDRAGTDHLPA